MGVKSRFKVGDRVHYANEFFGKITETFRPDGARRTLYFVAIENGLEQGFPDVIPFFGDEIALAPERRENLHDSTTYDA